MIKKLFFMENIKVMEIFLENGQKHMENVSDKISKREELKGTVESLMIY